MTSAILVQADEAAACIPRGLCAFPITPADCDGQVDIVALRRLISRLALAQVDSIGLLGSTGVYMYLSREERRRALEGALDETGGSIPVIAGIGALRTDDAIRHAQDARSIGATAGLLSATSYTPLTEDEVFEHFSSIVRQSGLPVIIYDNPGATHFRFTPELVRRLCETPGIAGIKNSAVDATETGSHLQEQRAFAPSGFSIGYSGDWNATEAMIAGADVWHSVLGGLFPNICLRISQAAQCGNIDEARRLDAILTPIWGLFKEYSSLRVVYAVANLLDICRTEPPRPILPLSGAVKDKVADVLARLPKDIVQ